MRECDRCGVNLYLNTDKEYSSLCPRCGGLHEKVCEKKKERCSMAEIERVIEGLESIKQLGASGSPAHIKIDEAIQTIRGLQENIPKWHLVADGNLPSVSDTYSVACMKGEGLIDVTFAAFQSKYKKWNMTGSRAYWKVIAWTELPKFKEVE